MGASVSDIRSPSNSRRMVTSAVTGSLKLPGMAAGGEEDPSARAPSMEERRPLLPFRCRFR